MNSIKNKIDTNYGRIDQEVAKYQKTSLKVKECAQRIHLLIESQGKTKEKGTELKQKVQDLSHSKQLGMSLETYLDHKNEFSLLLQDPEQMKKAAEFLQEQGVDLTEFIKNPVEVIMEHYIQRKGWSHE